MPRTRFDFHDDRADAAAALSALREVGLNPGDVGGAWRVEARDQNASLNARDVVEVDQIGLVELSGWLADIAHKVPGSASPVALSDLLQQDLPDGDQVRKIQKTLLAGGGVVGVRARDTF